MKYVLLIFLLLVSSSSYAAKVSLPDLQVTDQWISFYDLHVGPSSKHQPHTTSRISERPMTTANSYLIHVEIENRGDGLLFERVSFVVTTTCIRGDERFVLGSGRTAKHRSSHLMYATYHIAPSAAGVGKCEIETNVDTLGEMEEAIEKNNTRKMGITYEIFPPNK